MRLNLYLENSEEKQSYHPPTTQSADHSHASTKLHPGVWNQLKDLLPSLLLAVSCRITWKIIKTDKTSVGLGITIIQLATAREQTLTGLCNLNIQ